MINQSVATPEHRSLALGLSVAGRDLIVLPHANPLVGTISDVPPTASGMDRLFSNLETVTILMPHMLAH